MEIFSPLLFLFRIHLLLAFLALPAWLFSQCDISGEVGLDCLEAPLLSAEEMADGAVYCATLPASNFIPGLATLCNGLGTSDNTGFIQFYPGSTQLSFLLEPTSCDTVDNGQGIFTGLQAAIYPACDFQNALLCQAACQINPFNLNLTNLTPGALYVLAVDGCNGAICSFDLRITLGELMNINPTGEPVVVGPEMICLNDAAVFSITQLPEEAIVAWEVDTDLVTNTIDQGRILEVSNWTDSGLYEVCSSIQLNPPGGAVLDTCLKVEVLETPVISKINNDTLLCPGDELVIAVEGSFFDLVQWENAFDQLSCVNCLSPTFTMAEEAITLSVLFTNSATGCEEHRTINISLQDEEQCSTPVNIPKEPGGIYLYPNPAVNVLFIKNILANEFVNIYSSDGRIVKRQEDASSGIDVSELPDGVYFMQIQKEDSSESYIRWVKKS